MTSGNVFLDKLFGAEVILCPSEKDVKEYAEEIMAERRNLGANPYYIPVGGSNHIGELGYVECIREIIEYDKDKFVYSYCVGNWKRRNTFRFSGRKNYITKIIRKNCWYQC